ncbi:MAG: PAS domain S-box protein [bacterium]
MKIKNSLITTGLIYTALLAVFCLITGYRYNQVRETVEHYKHINKMANAVSELSIVAQEYLLHGEKRMKQQSKMKYDSIGKTIELMKKECLEHPGHQVMRESIQSEYEILGNLFSQLYGIDQADGKRPLKKDKTQKEIETSRIKRERVAAQILMKALGINTTAYKFSATMQNEIEEIQKKARATLFVSFTGFFILSLGILFFIIRAITKPINELVKGTRIIGGGNLKHRIDIRTKNEFGGLAAAFNSMLENLAEVTASRDELNKEIAVRERAENGLRKSEEKYRELTETLNEMIYSANPETFVATFINSAVGKIYGYTVKEWLADPALWENTMHPEDRERVFAVFTKAKNDLENRSVEYRIIRKDKAVRWVEDHFSWQKGESGKAVSLNGTMYDITDRKRAEEKLAESENKLRNLLETVPLGIAISTPGAEGAVTEVNQYLCDIFGYASKDEFLSVPASGHYNDHEERKRFSKLREQGPVTNYETQFRRKDGTLFWGSVGSINQTTKEGTVQFINTFEDITERRRLEEQLLQSQKMEAIGQFVGGIAHDFNNLLTPILALSDLSVYFLSDEKALLGNLKEIKASAVRGSNLIAQLLAFSRKQVLRPETLNLNDLVRNISKMLVRIIGEDIKLNIHSADKLGNISVDPVQAEQIIMNLAINAKAAMPKGGNLTFETANVELDENYVKTHVDVSPGSYIMLAISDSGAGIEKETIDHIFEPFFTTKGDKGSGLGLSTVHGIVKQSGGDILVYSEPGHGTTFKIYFPRIHSKADIVVKKQISKKSLKGTETILVVEDEQTVRETIHQILKVFGYNPLLASTGAEAEKIIKEYKDKIHMLITDIILPGKLNGKDIAEKIIRARPDIKTLFISGYTENAIVENGILKENINFLQKPFDPDSLLTSIKEILDVPKANQ